MRRGQRFTPALLEKWHDKGRGTGAGSEYQPWHQVTRPDPGSRGRSHLINWRFGRLHHFLSDQEMVAFCFATMLPNLVDLREQYPLALAAGAPEIAAYQFTSGGLDTPGTQQIATELGYRYPVVRKNGVVAPWVMTTDLLLTLQNPAGGCELLAISVKHDSELGNARTLELLRIEREYWRRQDVFWLLLSPSLYHSAVANSVRFGMPWAVDEMHIPDEILNALGECCTPFHGLTFNAVLDYVAETLPIAKSDCQYALWQAIWSGRVPLDLSRSMRPHEPIALLPSSDFWKQNPIASRRTAWRN
jgi:hypothetical protein